MKASKPIAGIIVLSIILFGIWELRKRQNILDILNKDKGFTDIMGSMG